MAIEALQTPQLPHVVDVVVLGAGHNGLVCAGYLAAAGLEVLVLEAREVVGGNTITEALTLPGFAHDSCSSAHVLIQSNPLISQDELGLVADYGLKYIHTDPAVVMPQANGDSLVMFRDVEATVEEIARWSPVDAISFRNLIADWSNGMAEIHGRWNSGLPLANDDATQRYLQLRSRSAWDVIHTHFTNPTVRSFMLWLSLATIQDPRRPGTGVLPVSIASGRLKFGWATPRGGSGALPEALVLQLAAHGARVACSSPVTKLVTSGGRVTAVETQDGRRVVARRAVVSSAHLAQMPEMFAPYEAPADLIQARDSWRPGLSVFAVHAALATTPIFNHSNGPIEAVAAGLGSTSGIAAQLDSFGRGEPDARDPWLLMVNQSIVDDSRAPTGSATLKLLTIAPYERADGRTWATTKDSFAQELMDKLIERSTGLDNGNILALRAESPVDVAAHNSHNLGGSCHGGEFVVAGGGVIPGWTSYRTSLEGLYLTGATSHPGGSVSGRPGRNAARAVLHDLGIDPARVMSSQ